jgi:O-acetyl-ADP-ribose deacetylase (regulator of RNase III)
MESAGVEWERLTAGKRRLVVRSASVAEQLVDCLALLEEWNHVDTAAKLGKATATFAVGSLRCRVLVRARGPVWNATQPRTSSFLLRNAVRAALACAQEHDCRSVVIPASCHATLSFPWEVWTHVVTEEIMAVLEDLGASRLEEVCLVDADRAKRSTLVVAALRLRPLHEWSSADVSAWSSRTQGRGPPGDGNETGAKLAELGSLEWQARFPAANRDELLRPMAAERLWADTEHANPAQDDLSMELLRVRRAYDAPGCGVLYEEQDGVLCAVHEARGPRRGL